MLALIITATFLVVEIVGGLWFNSLALLSDAVHMVTDVAALALAVVAQRVAQRPRTATHSYGFRRAETLAAFVNGIALAAGAVWIVVEAFERWSDPPPVVGGGMLAVAVAGLVANLASAWILSRGGAGHGAHAGHGHGNLNTRAALFHVMSDAAGSVGAIIAAGLVMGLGWTRADAGVSFLLAALILYGAWRLVRSAVDVLMEGAPRHATIAHVERTIRATPGVVDVHDVHTWSISDGFPVVTAHVVVAAGHDACAVARDVGSRLREEHGIDHATIQPESTSQPASVETSTATAT